MWAAVSASSGQQSGSSPAAVWRANSAATRPAVSGSNEAAVRQQFGPRPGATWHQTGINLTAVWASVSASNWAAICSDLAAVWQQSGPKSAQRFGQQFRQQPGSKPGGHLASVWAAIRSDLAAICSGPGGERGSNQGWSLQRTGQQTGISLSTSLGLQSGRQSGSKLATIWASVSGAGRAAVCSGLGGIPGIIGGAVRQQSGSSLGSRLAIPEFPPSTPAADGNSDRPLLWPTAILAGHSRVRPRFPPSAPGADGNNTRQLRWPTATLAVHFCGHQQFWPATPAADPSACNSDRQAPRPIAILAILAVHPRGRRQF